MFFLMNEHHMFYKNVLCDLEIFIGFLFVIGVRAWHCSDVCHLFLFQQTFGVFLSPFFSQGQPEEKKLSWTKRTLHTFCTLLLSRWKEWKSAASEESNVIIYFVHFPFLEFQITYMPSTYCKTLPMTGCHFFPHSDDSLKPFLWTDIPRAWGMFFKLTRIGELLIPRVEASPQGLRLFGSRFFSCSSLTVKVFP
jgi:hypothetical protein